MVLDSHGGFPYDSSTQQRRGNGPWFDGGARWQEPQCSENHRLQRDAITFLEGQYVQK